jgi:hypothetical protein
MRLLITKNTFLPPVIEIERVLLSGPQVAVTEIVYARLAGQCVLPVHIYMLVKIGTTVRITASAICECHLACCHMKNVYIR